MMGMALTGKMVPYKVGFGPFPPDVHHVAYPIALHGVQVEDSIRALEALFKVDIDPRRVAAVVIEPVQGEGGFYVAPTAFLQKQRAMCDERGILLVADEIQSGFARTGKFFAMEHHGIAADIVVTAKSLAGGLPLSAVTGRSDVMEAAAPGGLGGTYAGSPLAIAAALAVIDVIRDEKLTERAAILGRRIRAHLEGLRTRLAQIIDVRGLGAMVAMELEGAELARKVQAAALARSLILLTCGVHSNVIRFLMPLTIEDEVLEEALELLEGSLRECAPPQA